MRTAPGHGPVGGSLGRGPGDGLRSAWVLGAVLLLVVNDHWAKEAFHNGLTGKLSDLAGLLFFPLLLQALFEVGAALLGRYRGPSNRILAASALSTGLVFAATNLWQPAAWAYRHGLGLMQWPVQVLSSWLHGSPLPPVHTVHLVMDPTDLIALPMVALAVVLGRRRGS